MILPLSATSAWAQGAAKPRPAARPGAVAAPQAAPPAATPGEADERCLFAMALLTRDQKNAQAASLAMIFYAGRLSARGLDVPGAVAHAKAKLAPQQIPAELQRCGPVFQTSFRSLQTTFAPPPGAQQQAQPGTPASPSAPSAPATPPAPATPAAPAQPH